MVMNRTRLASSGRLPRSTARSASGSSNAWTSLHFCADWCRGSAGVRVVSAFGFIASVNDPAKSKSVHVWPNPPTPRTASAGDLRHPRLMSGWRWVLTYPTSSPDRSGEATPRIEDTSLATMRWALSSRNRSIVNYKSPCRQGLKQIVRTSPSFLLMPTRWRSERQGVKNNEVPNKPRAIVFAFSRRFVA
jgi:hypothetical protein